MPTTLGFRRVDAIELDGAATSARAVQGTRDVRGHLFTARRAAAVIEAGPSRSRNLDSCTIPSQAAATAGKGFVLSSMPWMASTRISRPAIFKIGLGKILALGATRAQPAHRHTTGSYPVGHPAGHHRRHRAPPEKPVT